MPTLAQNTISKSLLILIISSFLINCLGKPIQRVRLENQRRIIPAGFFKIHLQQVINLSDEFLLSSTFRSLWQRYYQHHPYFTPVYKKQSSHFIVKYTIQKFKTAILPRPSLHFPQRTLFWIKVSVSFTSTKKSFENISHSQDVCISHLEVSDHITNDEQRHIGTKNLLRSLFFSIDNFLLRGDPLPQENYLE